jgi:hypothetical protein
MAELIPEVQQLIATTAVVGVVPFLGITLAAILMRQLRWFGYIWSDDDG